MEFYKMKKTLLITGCLALFPLVLISCGSTKEVQASPDTYVAAEDIAAPVANPDGTEDVTADATDTENTTNKAKPAGKKKKNAIEEFLTFGNKDDYIVFDQTTVFTKEITGMTEKNAKVVIRYDNHMAGFGSYNSAGYYYLQFDQDSRAALAKAAQAYFSDFENKRLQRKGKKTERAYGKIRYMLNWGAISSATPNNGTGEGYLGYEFVKNSPYFTIFNYDFKNDYYDRAGDATTRKSPFVKYYFTRAQLKNLVEFLSEENITKQIIENDPEYIFAPSASDEY